MSLLKSPLHPGEVLKELCLAPLGIGPSPLLIVWACPARG